MIKLFLSFMSAGFFICPAVFAQKDTRNIDNISCIGNGRMAVYQAKADILQIFGPPYSSPSILDMILDDTAIQVRSQREKGTAIWTHTLWRNDSLIGSIVDLMDSASPVLIRKFNLNSPVRFSIHFADKIRIIPNTDSYAAFHMTGALLAESPRGVPYYNDYPMPFKQFVQLAGEKNLQIISDSASGKYSIIAGPGEAYLYLTGGPLYPDCISHTLSALGESYESIARGAHDYWRRFTSRRSDFEKLLPAATPEREKLLYAIDAVAVNCKTQQSIEGGVLAGHNYHLGYVRDQYGVSRGLLKMGYYTEARGILDFFWQMWKKKGLIHNAQGIGIDIFHIHENDEVEITGYLIIQTFDYLEKSGDQAFLKEIFPMLEWAFNSEKKNLAKRMLPFNGDETYIAGGILPRSCMVDGSAEATLLFITGANKLIPFAEKNKLWSPSITLQNRKIVEETTGYYRENFFINEQLYCNNTSRSEGLVLPAFRHGVCEGLGPGCEFYGWTQKNENNRYLCPVCFAKMNLPKKLPATYLIRSVSMMPQYMGSTIFSKKEINEMLKATINDYKQTGRLPSRPDGNVTVGYDYGLLLYNLTQLNDPLKKEIYEKMMSVLDETGSWVEYYENGKATGTRYRPWESGINIEAAIEYAESLNNTDDETSITKQHLPLIGAIRWDGWFYDTANFVTKIVQKTLAPKEFHDRLPFFAKEISGDSVFVNGSPQEVMDREIAYAKAGKLDYWAFVLYSPGEELSRGMDNYLKSPHRHDINFSIITEQARVVPDNTVYLNYITSLLQEPGYQQVENGRPLWFLGFVDSTNVKKTWGSFHQMKKALDLIRGIVMKSGLKNPYLVIMDFNASLGKRWSDSLGGDAISSYATSKNSIKAPYKKLDEEAANFWDECKATGSQVVPICMAGWSPKPRTDYPNEWSHFYPKGAYYANATAAELASHVRKGLIWLQNNRFSARAQCALIYAWNEYDEGGWLGPTLYYGTERLDALSAAIKEFKK